MQLPDWLSHDETWWKRTGGIVASLATGGLTLWIGFKGAGNPGVLALVSVGAQIVAAYLFASYRKADPGHARTIVQQMITISSRLSGLVTFVQGVQNQREPKATAQEIRDTLGAVNVRLSYLAEDSGNLVESWANFDPGTVQSLGWDAAAQAGDGTDDDGGDE